MIVMRYETSPYLSTPKADLLDAAQRSCASGPVEDQSHASKMNPNEIFITVKPAKFRDMVRHSLKAAGFNGSDTGYGFGTGDLWLTPPEGCHVDEFGPDMTVLENYIPSEESPANE